MNLTIINLGGRKIKLQNIKDFEMRTNNLENWIRIIYEDRHTEIIYNVSVVKTV